MDNTNDRSKVEANLKRHEDGCWIRRRPRCHRQ